MDSGDVVQLKSGGLPMTVVDVDEDTVSLLWMDSEGEIQEDEVYLKFLKPYIVP